ncbi:Histone deacetylase hda1 [Rhizina undulata]
MTFHQILPNDNNHLEDPRRIIAICNALLAEGLVEESKDYRLDSSSGLIARIGAREARKEEVLLINREGHWTFLELTKANISCGGAIEACQAAVTAAVKNSIAVIPPPGHHAKPCKAMGFSMFNNVSVAARETVHKWHFTMTLLSYTFPYTVTEKDFIQVEMWAITKCVEKAVGLECKIERLAYLAQPCPDNGLRTSRCPGRGVEVVMPITLEFNPDLVISFDAAAGNLMGGCYVTPAGYAHMTYLLMTLAEGKVVVCLEVTKVLMGDPPGTLYDEFASKIAVEVVNKCEV